MPSLEAHLSLARNAVFNTLHYWLRNSPSIHNFQQLLPVPPPPAFVLH
jgi:hypothetical protein